MNQSLFVNLPIRNLKQTVDFFTALGFTFNPEFTNDVATCMNIREGVAVMLLEDKFFESFIDKTIPDTAKHSEVLLALMFETKEEVDLMGNKALANGARRYREPEDNGYMYSWGFEDLNGHIWELGWMDMDAFKAQKL